MDSSADCTLTRCSPDFLANKPSLAGNAVFIALFAILVPLALGLGVRYKTSVFATTISTGLALEVLGYVGRILLYNNPTSRPDFILFLVGTILGSNFICGAIFLVIPHIVAVYGDDFGSWRPVWYQFLLHGLTVVSAVLELGGVLVSVMQDSGGGANTGVHVLATGIAIQLVALAIFIGHAMLLAITIRVRIHRLETKFDWIYNSVSFKAFLLAFSFATILLTIRTAFRIIAIAEGYESSIAQSETLLLVLDGLMVLLAILALLVFFPGRILGSSWSQTSAPKPSRTVPLRTQVPAYELPSARNTPTYKQMGNAPPIVMYTPRRTHYAEPLPQRNMVDSDSLW
ncbi:RTA1 like protein-domain-containing protein [Hypoxylon sp. FL1284]|nr:RTA1 like protein-domain-containing protein [Hypoxylon sp. FL1284]